MDSNQFKASAIDATADTILIAATLAAGVSIFHLLANAPQAMAVIAAIAVAFGVDSFLRPILADTIGPIVDRLRGLEPEGTDQS